MICLLNYKRKINILLKILCAHKNVDSDEKHRSDKLKDSLKTRSQTSNYATGQIMEEIHILLVNMVHR